jgi:hypothetical protein
VALAIGVDIGGSKVLGGVVDEQGSVIDTELRDTPGHDVLDTETVIVEVVDTLSRRLEVAAVGIGAAGWVGTGRCGTRCRSGSASRSPSRTTPTPPRGPSTASARPATSPLSCASPSAQVSEEDSSSTGRCTEVPMVSAPSSGT